MNRGIRIRSVLPAHPFRIPIRHDTVAVKKNNRNFQLHRCIGKNMKFTIESEQFLLRHNIRFVHSCLSPFISDYIPMSYATQLVSSLIE